MGETYMTRANNPFYLKDGKAIWSLKGLLDILSQMDDTFYSHYVNETKNDFSNWIAGEMRNHELAERLRYKNRSNTIQILNEILKSKILPKEKPKSISESNHVTNESSNLIKPIIPNPQANDKISDELKELEKNLSEMENKINHEKKSETEVIIPSPEKVIMEDKILKTSRMVNLDDDSIEHKPIDEYAKLKEELANNLSAKKTLIPKTKEQTTQIATPQSKEEELSDSYQVSFKDKLAKFKSFKNQLLSESKTPIAAKIKPKEKKFTSEVRNDRIVNLTTKIDSISKKVLAQSKLLAQKDLEIQQLKEIYEKKLMEKGPSHMELKQKENIILELEKNAKHKLIALGTLFHKMRKVLKEKDIPISESELQLLDEANTIIQTNNKQNRRSTLSDINVDQIPTETAKMEYANADQHNQIIDIDKLEKHIQDIEKNINDTWEKYEVDIENQKGKLKRFSF